METPGDTAVPPARRSPYPRPWWIAIPRFFLAFWFFGGIFLYPVVLISAIERHTLLTDVRFLIDPRLLVWYIPLTAAGGWAYFDGIREENAERARRRAEHNHPEQKEQRRLVAARAKGDRQAELEALGFIGYCLVWEHHEEATPYLEEALSLARALGNHPYEEERALYFLGVAAFKRGDQDATEDLFRQSLAVATTLDVTHRGAIASTYENVGEFLCEYRDKREEGCQMLAQAQAIYHEIAPSDPRWLDDEQHMRDLRRQYGDESV